MGQMVKGAYFSEDFHVKKRRKKGDFLLRRALWWLRDHFQTFRYPSENNRWYKC